jgi:DNA repair photolyase
LRDIDLFKQFKTIDVGLSVTTHDEEMRKIFELHSPSIASRIETLRTLHNEKIATYVFIGPMLPLDPDEVVKKLEGLVDEVLIDRMNYSNKVKALYRKHKLERYLEDAYFRLFGDDLKTRFEKLGIPVTMIF